MISAPLTLASISLPAPGPDAWYAQLRPASFRGVPFGVLTGSGSFGRRNAIHEYPYRDTVWVEDLGRSARRIQVVGFILGPDCNAIRNRMIGMAEAGGDGELVHPTLGPMMVSVLNFSCQEKWDEGQYYEITFSLIEAGKRVFPSAAMSPNPGPVMAACAGLTVAAAADFGLALTVPIAVTAIEVATAAAALAVSWGALAYGLAQRATLPFSATAIVPGPYGRYYAGRTVGGFAPVQRVPITVAAALAQATTARAAVDAAVAALTDAGNDLTAMTATDDYAVAAQAVALAVLAAANDPALALAILFTMTDFAPGTDLAAPNDAAAVAAARLSSAAARLFRRATVVALAQAALSYQPWSCNDAQDVLQVIAGAMDAAITEAGDAGEDVSYQALRTLRAASVADIVARGASLAPIATFEQPRPRPALVLATRAYRDPARADELVRHVDPIHPAFMPTTYRALAA